MRSFFWLLFLQGFLCNESPLKIHPNPLDGWKGLCMVIPCHISETLYSDELKPTAVVWYFNPVFDQHLLSYNGRLLYDSSKTSMELNNATSHNFRDRVRFVGDLSQGDCSLMITDLRANDSGIYGVIVAASVGKMSRRQMLYCTVVAHIRESPPKPKIEMVDEETQEWWTMKVACSVPYHCPDERMTLTFVGLEKNQQKMTTADGMIQTVATVEPILKNKKDKTMTCLLSSNDGSLRSNNTVELEGPLMEEEQWPHQTFHTAMKKVRVVTTTVEESPGPSISMGSHQGHPEDIQLILLNNLPIKEGDKVSLNCSVGRSFPDDNWYNWVKSDTDTAEIQYSRPKLLTFHATPGSVLTYQCEACNRIGCVSSQPLSIDVHYSPKEVKMLKWSPEHIVEGSDVKLKCEVGMANPYNLTYTWYHGEEQIIQNSAQEMVIFSNVTSNDSGDYRCEVSNSVGRTVSSRVSLFVFCVQCYESPLSITLSSRIAWEGSCVWIPCQINEHDLSDKTNITSLLWYFDSYIWYSNIDHLLYDSSNTSMNLTSPNFQGRVKFIGDLSKGDCSLLITHLQTRDSGWFRARTVISLPNYPWPLKRFLSAMVNITELPPEPKIRTNPTEIHEGKPTKVICSALYHCPDEKVTLTLAGLQKDRLSSQQTTIENKAVQTVLSFRPTLEDHGKVLRCLYKSQAGSRRSQATMELDVKFAPSEVKAVQDPEEVIKMGLTLQLECKVGKANPKNLTYAWYKNGQQLPLDSASSALLTIQKVGPNDPGLYHCEASNSVGTSGSWQVELTSLCSPSLPDDCFVKAWNPQPWS